LGDYVNRGEHSILTLSLLLALKVPTDPRLRLAIFLYSCLFGQFQVRYPSHVHLLRGNHESKGMAYQCSHLLLPTPLSSAAWPHLTSSPLLRINRYNLHEECPATYGTGMALELLFEVFRCLPLAAVVNETVGAPLSTHSLHQLSGDLLHLSLHQDLLRSQRA
jgi:hypothetical protein